MTLKRSTSVIPAYDHIVNPCGKGGCGKTPGGSHGRCSEEWIYCVSDGECALVLRVFSGIYLYDHPRRPSEGGYISVHHSFPTCSEQLISADTRDCTFVDAGKCFTGGYNSSLAATEFWADFGHKDVKEQPEDFWSALEAKWEEVRPKERFDRTHKICDCCKGSGVVER